MQAFLSGFWRVRHSKARGGLGKLSGTGFLGCFFLRPSSWGEDGSMFPAAWSCSPPTALFCVLCVLALGTGPLSLQGQCWAPGVGLVDYSPCSQGVKLASHSLCRLSP